MGAPIKSIVVSEGIVVINFVDNKIWGFRPSSPQYEGAYVVGNIYASPEVTEPTPAN